MSKRKSNLQDAMATALSLDHWTAPAESLCDYPVPSLSVNFLCMDQADVPIYVKPNPTSQSRAARFQEIFLDLAGWYAARQSSSRFLLDVRFDSILSKDERELKDGILLLLEKTKSNGSDAYISFSNLLEEKFGLGTCDSWTQRRVERMKLIRKASKPRASSCDLKEESILTDTDTTPTLKEIIQDVKRNHQFRRSAALSELDPNDLDQLKAFFADILPSYRDKLEPSIASASPDRLTEFQQLFEIPSHVFVCNSSVCDLACDAFLCPASIGPGTFSGFIWRRWLRQTKVKNTRLWRKITMGEHPDRVEFDMHPKYDRVAVIKNWPHDCTEPLILPTEISMNFFLSQGLEGFAPDEHIKGLMESVRHFLFTAYDLVKDKPVQNNRERHLFALPIVGTGFGGAADLTGEIVRNLLNVLDKFVAEHKVDCVIVAADEATYAHAQTVRDAPTSILSLHMSDAATDLAKLAASGHLSLFLGAGTSIASGLPSWIGLLNAIEDNFTPSGATNERCIGKNCSWEPLKMADELEQLAELLPDRYGIRLPLKTRVSNFIEEMQCQPSLVLALLLSLPSKSIMTTNYDRLIETAYQNRNIAENNEAKLSILPHNPKPGAKEWLLKMHGCVSHPDKIVLSGKDYSQRKILGGIVQSNLLTTHLLFCGFSLTDPNYLKIIQEVRDALSPSTEVGATGS